MSNVKEIVQVIKSCLPKRRPIEHHEPFIDIKDAYYELGDALLKGITGYEYINLFGSKIKEITKTSHCILTSSGTAALELSIRALGLKPGDEILIPASTFVGTANAVMHAGCVPYFVDLNLTPHKLRQILQRNDAKGIKALIIVHLFGIPVHMEGVCEVAKEFNLKVIEDAAQALGSSIGTKHCGTFATIATYSFNNNKIITTNGGGAAITDDEELADKVLRLSTTSRISHRWLIEHDQVAFNYRMGNINAALGYAQLHSYDRILASKRSLAVRYRHRLKDLAGFFNPTFECEPNYWLNTLLTDDRDELLTHLHDEGIRARAVFTPLHKLLMYKDHKRSDDVLPEADRLFERGVCLPSGNNL